MIIIMIQLNFEHKLGMLDLKDIVSVATINNHKQQMLFWRYWM